MFELELKSSTGAERTREFRLASLQYQSTFQRDYSPVECNGMEPFPVRIKFGLRNVIRSQYRLSLSHHCDDNEDAFFRNQRGPRQLEPQINISKLLNVSIEQAEKRTTREKTGFEALIEEKFNNATLEQQDCQLEEYNGTFADSCGAWFHYETH